MQSYTSLQNFPDELCIRLLKQLHSWSRIQIDGKKKNKQTSFWDRVWSILMVWVLSVLSFWDGALSALSFGDMVFSVVCFLVWVFSVLVFLG